MGYIENNLGPGEQVTIRAKLSWVMFLSPIILIGLGFLLLIVFYASQRDQSMAALICASWVIILVGVINFLSVLITEV